MRQVFLRDHHANQSSRSSIDDLQAALAANDTEAIVEFFNTSESAEAVHATAHLSDQDQSRLLTSLSWEQAADLVDDLPEEQAAKMIERLSVDEAAAIVCEMPSNEQADVIAHLPELEASAILDAMPLAYSRSARRLMSYPADSAGGLTVTEYLSYPQLGMSSMICAFTRIDINVMTCNTPISFPRMGSSSACSGCAIFCFRRPIN